MDVIPVIDLKGGRVVRAHMGQRDRYRPIETPLARGSDPVDVTRGLLSVFRFRALYVADLDAIERAGDNDAALTRIRNEFPHLAIWLDNGTADATAAQARLADCDLVLGSEAQRDTALVASLGRDPRALLSLDFRGETFVGPPQLLATPQIWPQRVIVMTLARVGSGAGPDLERLREIKARAGTRRIYAAGGVRHADDLATLANAGIAGALIASALHDGRLTGAEIERL